MEDTEYRYTELTGGATIERSGTIIEVTLWDKEVNPNKKPLRFDNPIYSDPDASPEHDGTIDLPDIHIVAGLNLDWYTYHTQVDGFRFKKENGEFAQEWMDLDFPKGGEKMDPVKPGGRGSNLQTTQVTANLIKSEVR